MGDIQRCPCCKTCDECPYFQNVVNIKNAGLLIYRYSCVQGVNIYTGKNESSTEIFILHNTKTNEIASEKLLPKLGKYKKCPRCKYILEHAEKILLNFPTVNKLDVLGICDKCRNKDRKGISSCECSEAIEKFIAIIKSNKKEATKGKQRQFKLQKLLNFLNNKDVESKTLYARTKSDSNLDKIICHVNSKQKCDLQGDQLIVVKKDSRGTNGTEVHGRVQISKTAQKIRFSLKNHSDTELAELDSDITRFGSNVKHDKMLHADEKNNLIDHDATSFKFMAKKEKDYPLRRISISEESLFNFHDLLDKPDDQPKIRTDSLRPPTHVQKEPRLDEDKTPSILDLIAAQNRYKQEYSKTDTHEFDTKSKPAVMSSVGTGILKSKMETKSPPDNLPEYKSGEAFSSSLLAKTNELIRKDFSYFFIKEAELKKKPIQKHKSSSELIKDTQDMLLAREENLKRKYEEELKRKLEEEEKKRKAREEKIKLLKESKTILGKDTGKKQGEDDLEKLDVTSKKSISIEKLSKDVRSSEKSRKSGIKTEPKGDKIAEEKFKKNQNEKETHEKEKEEQSTKEIRGKYKIQSTREKERKEPSEKEKSVKDKEMRKKETKDKSVKDKETRGNDKKEPSENVREKQFEKEIKTREQQKDKMDRNEKPKRNKEEEEKSGKDNNIINESLKNVNIEKIKAERKDMEGNKVPDMKKEKEDAALRLKALREMENKADNVLQQPKPVHQIEEPKIKELNINQVKVRQPSHDDLILHLVKLKQADEQRRRPRSIAEIHIPLTLITDHKKDHKHIKLATCAICNDSELELDIEEIILNKAEKIEINNIIIGKKIFKYKQPLKEKSDEKQVLPIFMSTFNDDLISVPEINADNESEKIERKPPPMLEKYVEHEQPKGVIRYALSDRTFIEKGWTMLPTEKVVRKMNVYRMRPAHPEFDWFEHNKNKKIMQYDTGEKLAEFDDNGRGRLYYRSGRLALDYYNAEEINAQQRFVIHSSGEPDARGCSRPLAILATFDYLGNGIVFDHTGKIRLKYNQTEGVVLDRSIGPVSHWKWHTLNDPPVLQQVMIDTQMTHKDPDILKLGGPAESKTRTDNEEMLAIEFDNFIKEKSKKLSQKFKPFQIKMKALKINEHFSLRVLDQATIYLIFRDGSTNLKINLGMILDHQEIVDTDTAEVGEVSNSLERFPARTDSLAALQNSVAFAQRVERARIERERRLRPTQPCSSSDRLASAVSRPLRAPLRTVASESTVATCRCRKPPSNNLYYDTRLV